MKQKERVVCPECGHRHTITVTLPFRRAMTVGVRARRVTGNQFEYSLAGPAEVLEDDTKFLTVYDDLILTGAVGGAAGALCGLVAATIAPDYAPQIIGGGFTTGVMVAWGWLCAEHNTRLKRVLPWFVEQKSKWPTAGPVNDGQLTVRVDHIHRDSYSDVGRTINYLGVLPVDLDRFCEYARKIIIGDSLAIAHWTGSGKLFSRKEYDDLLEMLRNAGIVAKVDGKGHMLTAGGRHSLKRIIDHPPAPPVERA